MDKKITLDDFPENFQPFINITGVDTAIEISKMYGGTTLYIPKFEELHRRVRNQQIIAEFNGSNYLKLCLKYNLTEAQIRNIIKENRKQPTVEDYLKDEDPTDNKI